MAFNLILLKNISYAIVMNIRLNRHDIGGDDMDNYLEDMALLIRKKELIELENKYKKICEEISTEEIAQKISNIDITNYLEDVEKQMKNSIKICKEIDSCKAIYFEYDMDNNWKGNIFLCDDYAKEKEENDDWASSWSEYIEGPDNKEFYNIYKEYGSNDLGVTLYLIARTISGIGRVVDKIKGIKIPICIAYHDQSSIFRIKEITKSKKKKYNLEDVFFIDVSDSNNYGCAIAPKGIHSDVFPIEGYVNDIEMIFKLQDGIYSDFMNNNLGLTICSEKFKEIIDKNKSETDIIQWIDTYIQSENEEKRKYYILRLPVLTDCIDFNKSKFFEAPFFQYAGYICLDKNKICGRQVLKIKYPEGKAGPSRLIVSGKIRKDIEENKLAGIIFEKLDVE